VCPAKETNLPKKPRRAGDGPSDSDDVERGREAYRNRAWAEAHRRFSVADARAPLPASDLELFAWAAALMGRDEDFLRLMDRLYQEHLDRGEEVRAARCAFWVGLRLSILKEPGRAGGWLARAERLTVNKDCVERGYLLLPVVRRNQVSGDFDAANVVAAEAAAIADRFRDADLGAFARAQQGNMLLSLGQVERGLALLDEAMVAVTSGELNPVLTGLIYCISIAGCSQVYLMDRAREWTAALATWCDAQPDLVLFNGTCLVHRAELMQLGGAWRDAIAEAQRASERVVAKVDPETAADSLYQQAEVHRLRGDFEVAERAYREASELGRDAQPGLALLRLSQGRAADAVTAMRRVLRATSHRLRRARLLPAYIEIALAAGEAEEARGACGELEAIASDVGTEVLGAMAAHARGAVELAAGRVEAALEPLRRAFDVWHGVGAPYIAARVRVLLARACRALGDRDTARLELDLAREVFERLGAAPDIVALAALEARDNREGRGTRKGLSPRELEVLRLVASGKTNRIIARELCLSEKTIDRHVSNIFTKINVASRTAATAYAYQQGLV
jgi:DNA-binding CsgD family transcriptional regulator